MKIPWLQIVGLRAQSETICRRCRRSDLELAYFGTALQRMMRHLLAAAGGARRDGSR